MINTEKEWRAIRCGGRKFFVDFTFHDYFGHKRCTGRFPFHQSLFKFLDEENAKLDDTQKYTLYLSSYDYLEDPFFRFEETGRRLFVNYKKFKESCEKSNTSNKDYAKLFFGKGVNLRAVLQSKTGDEKRKIILESLDEATVLNWWENLSKEDKNAFSEKINTGFDFAKLPDCELIEAIKKRNLNIEDIQDLNLKFEIKKLQDAMRIWEEHKENPDENFWQKTFEDKHWILSQIFACPVVFVKGKPYCGGKNPDDKGGVYSDFRFSKSAGVPRP